MFFLLDGEEVGDVDVCGMMYVAEQDEDDEGEEDYEEVSEGEYNRVLEHQGKYCNHKCDSCPMHAQCGQKTEEKPKAPTQDESLDKLFKQQADAKKAEHKIDRAANLTKIDYKDDVIGTGRTAMAGMTVGVRLELRENDEKGEMLEKTPEGKQLTFKLGKKDVSEGLQRIVIGMRQGGVRTATGPASEIIEQDGAPKWVQVTLVSVK